MSEFRQFAEAINFGIFYKRHKVSFIFVHLLSELRSLAASKSFAFFAAVF